MADQVFKELPEFLDTKSLPALGLTPSWATKNRVYAVGDDLLPFIRVGGKILYRTATVRTWLEAREQRGTTRAEAAPARAGDRAAHDSVEHLPVPRRGRRRAA